MLLAEQAATSKPSAAMDAIFKAATSIRNDGGDQIRAARPNNTRARLHRGQAELAEKVGVASRPPARCFMRVNYAFFYGACGLGNAKFS